MHIPISTQAQSEISSSFRFNLRVVKLCN